MTETAETHKEQAMRLLLFTRGGPFWGFGFLIEPNITSDWSLPPVVANMLQPLADPQTNIVPLDKAQIICRGPRGAHRAALALVRKEALDAQHVAATLARAGLAVPDAAHLAHKRVVLVVETLPDNAFSAAAFASALLEEADALARRGKEMLA